jgi:two-component system OmpR family response regulator
MDGVMPALCTIGRERDMNGLFIARSRGVRYIHAVRVLVVEDETRLATQLATALGHSGYAVDVAGDGARADRLARTETYDAIVLDLGLPRVDGLTLLRAWREAHVTSPVLILTARGSWHEKVQGIDGGADDYVAKPFEMEEVLARVRALIRRAAGQTRTSLRCGALTLDTRLAQATLGDAPVTLTSHEYRVLAYLMHHRDRIVTRTELAEHIYAHDLDRDSNTVEVFVARLRRKLGRGAVLTLRGIGYRMGEPRATDEAPSC